MLIFHPGVPVAILWHMISTLEKHVPATFANTPEGNALCFDLGLDRCDAIHVRTNMNDMIMK